MIPTQCVILAGGLGTRLGGLTLDTPKPMLEVAGRPFIEHIIENTTKFGLNNYVILAGYKGCTIANHFSQRSRDYKKQGIEIVVNVEPTQLGTGGALAHSEDYLQETFVLLNGDTIFDINILDLATRDVDPHALLRVALRIEKNNTRFGSTTTDETGRVTSFRPKPIAGEEAQINGGTYIVNKKILKYIPAQKTSLEHDVIPRVVHDGKAYAWSYDRYFIDIGIPEDLRSADSKMRMDLDRRYDVIASPELTYRCETFATESKLKQLASLAKSSNDSGSLAILALSGHTIMADEALDLLNTVNTSVRKYGAYLDDICTMRPSTASGGIRHEYERLGAVLQTGAIARMWQKAQAGSRSPTVAWRYFEPCD